MNDTSAGADLVQPGLQAGSAPRSAPPAPARFHDKIDRSGGPNACWPWTGARDDDGYGNFKLHGRVLKAHIVAFVEVHGYQPPMVCHSCDNPPCCNPDHLFAGDAGLNNEDRNAKGRQARGNANGAAKLTAEIVAVCRARHEAGEGCVALAHEFGVNQTTMSKALRGATWR